MSFLWGRKQKDTPSTTHETLGVQENCLVIADTSPVEWQQSLNNLQPDAMKERIVNGSPRHVEESKDGKIDFIADYKKWREYAQALAQAESIVVCGHHDGLGDSIHHIRYAIAMAQNFPEKTIYFLVRNPEIFDTTKLPRNLQLNAASPKDTFINNPEEQTSDKTVVFNPSLYQNIVRKQFGGEASKFVFAETQKGVEGRDLFSAWHYTVAVEDGPLNKQLTQLRKDFRERKYYVQSCHQVVDQASKLQWLLGIQPQENFEVIPLIEPLREQQYDYFFIGDAAEGKGAKLLQPEQWAQLIASLYDKHKGEVRIALLQGRSNPDLWNQVFAALPDFVLSPAGKTDFTKLAKIIQQLQSQVLQTDLPGILSVAAGSQCVVTVDTGPGHMVNEYIRAQKSQQKPHPKLISVVGPQPFNPLYYRLDCGTTLVGRESARDVSMSTVVANLESGES